VKTKKPTIAESLWFTFAFFAILVGLATAYLIVLWLLGVESKLQWPLPRRIGRFG
jgi:hypothetical protein